MEDWQCDEYLDLEYCTDGSFRCELCKNHKGQHAIINGAVTHHWGPNSLYRKTIVKWE